jgi:RNA polymerase sigma factor (sigma-70 family)
VAHEDQHIARMADHLFRQESGRMVAVLTRIFGWHNAELIEDVVQDAFIKSWRFGLPENPAAWLMKTARNGAVDVLRRRRFQVELPVENQATLNSEYTLEYTTNNLFLDGEIQDSVLRMMFTCCHPVLSEADRIALTLKTVAGFSVDEVSRALLLNPEAAKKRLQRARTKLRDEGLLDRTFTDSIPTGPALVERLMPVLQVIYLIFNEGYGHSDRDRNTRKDLCLEALRLALVLSRDEHTSTTDSLALVAVLAFHAARFESRLDVSGSVLPLEEHDRSKIDLELVQFGLSYLARSAQTGGSSAYQIEATITYEHAKAPSIEETNWPFIADLYDALARLKPTSTVLLNRAIAIGQAHSAQAGMKALMEISDIEVLLSTQHVVAATYADLMRRQGETNEARTWYDRAIALASFDSEKSFLQRQLDKL